MRIPLLFTLGSMLASFVGYSQCSVTSAPSNNCSYYGMQITAFSLNNISSNNPSCSAGGYGNFATPVRSLLMGSTYNWTAVTGTGYYSLGFAIWIDLNNNGLFDATEMVAVSAPNVTHAGNLTIPLTATPGANRKMRIRSGYYSNITGGQACTSFLGGYGETEDYLVDITAPTPCAGAPSANTIVVPAAGICPNSSALLNLANSYTAFGYTYQWLSSTVSNVGPFTPISGATLTSYQTPTLNASLYYQAVITCTNGNATTTTTGAQLIIQGNTISQVPYNEGFEGITKNDAWPNCSWAATSGTTVSRTYTMTYSQQRSARSGSKFASFYYVPSGSNYVWTNGIQLYAGVTYSTGLWYKTNYYGDVNWSNMSILLGTSQSTTGLVSLASTSGPAGASVYTPLSNTFTVASSGIYYAAIRGTSSGGCCAYHLNWDDFSITAPCSLNTPTVSLTANSSTVCAGTPVTISATGASTYNWNTGATGNNLAITPFASATYSVVGTNTNSGCSATRKIDITVNQKPNILVYATKNSVCAGSPVQLTATGASNYTWSTGSNLNTISVAPTTATTYSVIGQSGNCDNQVTQFINVNQLPTVSASTERTDICKGESVLLTGAGAATYQWLANTIFLAAPQVMVTPNVSTTYTLVGTDGNGCSNSTTLVQNVSACLGLNGVTYSNGGVKLYPNPTTSSFNLEFSSSLSRHITVTDLTGRVIINSNSKSENMNVNLSAYASGVYYVKIQSEELNEVIKVVKD